MNDLLGFSCYNSYNSNSSDICLELLMVVFFGGYINGIVFILFNKDVVYFL